MRSIILFFALLVFLPSCSNKDKTEAAEFFERANYHFKKRELDKAYQFYSEAIDKVPDFADAYNNRGIILEKQANLEGAIGEYAKAVELDDSFDKAKINLALAKIQLGQLKGIDNLLSNLENSFLDSVVYHDAMGQYLLASSKSEEAISSLQKAIALGGQTPELLTNLGYAYYTLKNFSKAQDYLENAIEMKDDFEFALNNLSATYSQMNNWDKALEVSQELIELNDQEILFLNTHTLNLLENSKLELARSYINKAEKIAPENLYLLRNKAILALKMADYTTANHSLQELLNSSPDVEYLYYYLGLVATKIKQPVKACEYFKKGKFIKDFRSTEAASTCQ